MRFRCGRFVYDHEPDEDDDDEDNNEFIEDMC
jgi:hypothetical protein